MYSGSSVLNQALLAIVLKPVLRDLLMYAHGLQGQIYGQMYELLRWDTGTSFPAKLAYHYP